MKLTKFVHSCVLVEDDQHTTLFDPGQFTWESNLKPLDHIEKLDFVLITHEHFDHFHEPFIQAIAAKFPKATFYATPGVILKLKGLGITNASSTSDGLVEVAALDHDSMTPLAPAPQVQNVCFHYKNLISHPGDSVHLLATKDILFLPLAGPWEAPIEAVRLADKLKPKVIVPIHDWMWNDQWRASMYDRMESFFAEKGIRFIKTVDGEAFEV